MTPNATTSHALPPVDDLLRGIAAIVDPHTPASAIAAALATLLPTTRVDVLLNVPPAASMQLFLTTGSSHAGTPPASARANDAAFVRWLMERAYQAIDRFPIIDDPQLVGWVMLARMEGDLDAGTRAIGAEIANAFAQRHVAARREAELRATREALDNAEARLQAIEQIQRQAALAAGAAHDLNNLLAVIIGHTQILHQDVPPELRDDLWAILRAAQDGALLIRRMLARDRAPDQATPSVATVASVIQEAIRLTRPFWDRYGRVTVATDLAPTPPVPVDPTEIREVLVNLIMNAIAAMPEGGRLSLRSRALQGQVLIEVTDTGEGIAREYQATIFEPLQTTRPGSTGLGLTISRAIIEHVGGKLTVESTPGQGATFTIILPAVNERSLAAK